MSANNPDENAKHQKPTNARKWGGWGEGGLLFGIAITTVESRGAASEEGRGVSAHLKSANTRELPLKAPGLVNIYLYGFVLLGSRVLSGPPRLSPFWHNCPSLVSPMKPLALPRSAPRIHHRSALNTSATRPSFAAPPKARRGVCRSLRRTKTASASAAAPPGASAVSKRSSVAARPSPQTQAGVLIVEELGCRGETDEARTVTLGLLAPARSTATRATEVNGHGLSYSFASYRCGLSLELD
mmetsp:Transcript_21688/g.49033  ORF Transcript_21688/g.49033 Transcript_21688/m.49033 type:complete len:242 (+) Transcript_21688:90-815(+)